MTAGTVTETRPYRGPALLAAVAVLLLAWRLWVIPHLGITLYIDEAQYWTWAEHLAWGYFSKPPGVAGLIAASTALFGDGILGIKSLSMLCYPAAAGLAYVVARRLYDEPVALWSGLAVLTLPMFSWLGLFVSTDALLTLFWMLALWAYLNALERDGWGDWLLLGLIGGLGMLSKYTMIAWLAAAFLHLAVFHRPRLGNAKPWVAAALVALCLVPNVLWNVANDFPTLKHTADITLHKKAAGGFKALGEFLGAQWVAFGPILGSVFVLLLVTARRTWRDEKLRFLLWFSLPLWAVVSAQAFKSSANANWAAPAFAPAAIAVVAWLVHRGRQRWLAAGLVLNLLLVGVVYHWPDILKAAQVAEASRKDPFTRARGWDQLGRQLGTLLAARPQAVIAADNRTLLAHMSYELRGQHPAVASWNPSGAKSDHYKLTTDLNQYRDRDVLFITQDRLPEDIGRYFAGVEPAGHLYAPLDEKNGREMDVYLLHGFAGY